MVRIIAKGLLVVVAYAVGKQRARGLQVTLLANLHLTLVAEMRGIENGCTNLLQRSLGFCSFDVRCAGTVATLAIDTHRQRIVHRFSGEIAMRRWWNLRIRVVAEHALVGNYAASHWGSIVEAGIHGELAAPLRVPCHRQFDERAVLFSVMVGAHMETRAHHVVDRELLD